MTGGLRSFFKTLKEKIGGSVFKICALWIYLRLLGLAGFSFSRSAEFLFNSAPDTLSTVDASELALAFSFF